MTIVGSTYLEFSMFPYWKELYGSGWRAVCALAAHTDNINFYSYLADNEKKILSANPIYHDINSIQLYPIDKTLRFEYFHGLTQPKIFPHPCLIQKNQPIEVIDDVILRYGFIEGDAKVNGKRVIYDPQSATDPKCFYANGSVAKELVIVLNFREAVLLSDSDNLEEIKRQLLNHNTVALVLKLGPQGGKVITKDKIIEYNAYKTKNVFPIGSGDVFAAFIAYFWGEMNQNIYEAAIYASKAVATYCDTQTLPINPKFTAKTYSEVVNNNKHVNKKIYLAGPFFTMQERWLVEEARNNLKQHGFDVFSPVHDVGKGIAEDVVPADIEGIEQSDVLFAIVDGLDSGTIFEIGYARALGKGVVVYVQNETEENLKMLEGTDCQIENDFVTAIYKAKWLAMESE